MKAPNKKLVSANQLARTVSVTPATVLAWARAGKIPVAFQMERVWRFDMAEALAALKFNPKAQ